MAVSFWLLCATSTVNLATELRLRVDSLLNLP